MRLLDLHLGRPLSRGALTLFPLWDARAVAEPGYVLDAGGLSVRECPTPTVGQLLVANDGDRPVLLLDGEVLEGGRQTRMAVGSSLLPAGTRRAVPVRCVQQGRWSGPASHRRGGRRAPSTVRAARGQQQVWREVQRTASRLATTSPTSDLVEVTRDVDASEFAGLRPLPGQCGVLVGVAGQPLVLEAFDSPDVLAQAWAPLLASVAVDAAGAAPVPTPGRRARRFLDRLNQVRVAPDGSGGLVGTSPYARLGALHWQGRTVHVTAVNVRHELVGA